VASAGLYASLHLAPDRQPHQHPTTLMFFTGRMPFLPPNQQRQSTEDILEHTHRERNHIFIIYEYTTTSNRHTELPQFNQPFSGLIDVFTIFHYFTRTAAATEFNQLTASFSASCRIIRLPSNLINGHEFTISSMVRWSPHEQIGDFVSSHLLMEAVHVP